MKYKLHKQYRLPKFDYAGEGDYFVTICTDDRKHHFGEVVNGEMILSDIGKIVDKIWNEIPTRFNNVDLDVYQIMPDHFHGIVLIKEDKSGKGKHLINPPDYHRNINRRAGQMPTFKSGIENNPMELKSISLGGIIRWFKGLVKYEAKKLNPKFKWQSRFYDRIIRNDKEYYFIQEYIINNPVNWGDGILTKYFDVGI